MATLIPFLLFCQAFGVIVGVGTSVWGELAHIRALRDGRIDTAERTHLHILARGLRFGMTLLLLSSFGLVVVAYVLGETPQPVLTAGYWISVSLAFLIIGLSWALSRRRIFFSLGSAAALTAWWLLAYLTLGKLSLSFGAAVAVYVVLAAVMYALLYTIRYFAIRQREKASLA